MVIETDKTSATWTDLAATAETQHQVERGLLLDVVVSQGAAVFELLTREDQTLLIRRDAFLVLILRLDVVYRVRGLDFKRDGLARERLDKNLHATAETQHQVECGLLLDVVVSQGAAVFELLTREDQTLLIRRDAFLVLNLRLDVVNRVRGLDFKRDGLARERLDENLHATAETQHQVEC